MACRTGCATQDHKSYAECLRDAGVRVAYCNSANNMDYSRQKQWDKTLDAYRDARRQGIQPASTQRESIERAVRISDSTGEAWQA